MTSEDNRRGFITTPSLKPLSFIEWAVGHCFVYIAGIRTGALMIGTESCFYRSVDGGGKMFASAHGAIVELERLANWIIVANAEFCRRDAVYS